MEEAFAKRERALEEANKEFARGLAAFNAAKATYAERVEAANDLVREFRPEKRRRKHKAARQTEDEQTTARQLVAELAQLEAAMQNDNNNAVELAQAEAAAPMTPGGSRRTVSRRSRRSASPELESASAAVQNDNNAVELAQLDAQAAAPKTPGGSRRTVSRRLRRKASPYTLASMRKYIRSSLYQDNLDKDKNGGPGTT